MTWTRLRRICVLVSAAVAVTACKSLPDVNLTTPEPLKVDVNVRLDVYQYDKADGAQGAQRAGTTKAADSASSIDAVLKRQLNRMDEIQKLKNGRFAGEDHRGLLVERNLPADSYGDYIKKTIAEENEDREALMKETAHKENVPVHEVRTRAWKLAVEKAFVGEWIEVPAEKEGLYQWDQKK